MVRMVPDEFRDPRIFADWTDGSARWSLAYEPLDDGVDELLRYAEGQNMVGDAFDKKGFDVEIRHEIVAAPGDLYRASEHPHGIPPVPDINAIIVVESPMPGTENYTDEQIRALLQDFGSVILGAFGQSDGDETTI